MQGSFNICKSVNVIHYVKLKNKNQITSIDVEKAFYKIKHPFLIIILHKVGIDGTYLNIMGFPGGSVDKESTCNAGDRGNTGSIHRSGRSPGEGHGNPLQYSYLEIPMDRGTWGYSSQGCKESDTTELTDQAHMHLNIIKAIYEKLKAFL